VEFGWAPIGSDLAADAVRAAAVNVLRAPVLRADATRLPVRDGVVGAVVSNLPFGKQYELPRGEKQWLKLVFRECDRVLRPGTRAVFLTGRIIRPLTEGTGLQPTSTRKLRLLGQDAVITVCTRIT
jgi:tRNA G10  N-methylase Trm11